MKKRLTCIDKKCGGIQFKLYIDRTDERTNLIATCTDCGRTITFNQRKKTMGGI